MANVPLGRNAYSRKYAKEPEIRMVNRFFEEDPTNRVTGNSLLSRPGTKVLMDVGPGPIRAQKTQSGAFESSNFVVSGDTLYRVQSDKTIIPIAGTVGSVRRPSMDIVTGPSYEHLFISDGSILQLYEGLSFSRAVLSKDGTDGISDGDQVRIGDVYYQWTSGSVDAGTPDGTSANPWLLALGLAKASAILRFIASDRIDIAGYAVFIGDIPEDAVAGDGSLRHVYTVSDPAELERNDPNGSGSNPWRLATPEGITPRSFLFLLKSAINATGKAGVDYSSALVDPHELVKGGEVTGPSVPVDPTENSLIIRALQGGTSGNSIQVRNVLDRAPIWQWEDEDGNPTQSLTGGSDTTGDVASALENLSRAIGGSGIPGVDYSTALTPHPDVRVEDYEGDTVQIVSLDRGSFNSIETTTTSTGIAWSAATLEGGGEHRLDPVSTVTDPPAGAVAAVGGYVAVSIRGQDRFYWVRPGERTIDPLDFATAESAADRIVDMIPLSDQLVMLGAASIEFWSVTGNPDTPFFPSRGQTLNVGVLPHTAASRRNQILFVGTDGVVYATSGGPVERISTHGIEERIRDQLGSSLSADGIDTFMFDMDGHRFFVMHLNGPVPVTPFTVFEVDDARDADGGKDAHVIFVSEDEDGDPIYTDKWVFVDEDGLRRMSVDFILNDDGTVELFPVDDLSWSELAPGWEFMRTDYSPGPLPEGLIRIQQALPFQVSAGTGVTYEYQYIFGLSYWSDSSIDVRVHRVRVETGSETELRSVRVIGTLNGVGAGLWFNGIQADPGAHFQQDLDGTTLRNMPLNDSWTQMFDNHHDDPLFVTAANAL